ncbi:MAG: YceI family protein [Janthinobacterium lividum]
MIRFPLLPAALVLAVSGPALAQVASHEPSQVQAGTYAIDPQHTQVGFGVSHMGFTTYYGHFADASGTLELTPKNPAGSKLSVSVPTASVSTTSDKLDGELKGDQWFDAAKYPTITFTSTQIVPTGRGEAKVTGNLTMHGVTKPVTLDAKFVGAGTNPLDKKYTVGFAITGLVSRSEFGVKTYVPLIGDEVAITISGAFEKQG